MLLAGCASTGGQRAVVSDAPVRVGRPYVIGGVTYTPMDTPDYDVIGRASWYGNEHKGDRTANGERFHPGRFSAAHPTLPLPSYVEVTDLASGRRVLARVNDRGPFVRARVIDLSLAVAEALGIRASGTAEVRVRRVYPSEADRARLRSGKAAAALAPLSGQALSALRTPPVAPTKPGLYLPDLATPGATSRP